MLFHRKLFGLVLAEQGCAEFVWGHRASSESSPLSIIIKLRLGGRVSIVLTSRCLQRVDMSDLLVVDRKNWVVSISHLVVLFVASVTVVVVFAGLVDEFRHTCGPFHSFADPLLVICRHLALRDPTSLSICHTWALASENSRSPFVLHG